MDHLIGAFSALAQDTRLQVFRLLLGAGPEGLPAGEVARRLGTPHNTMSTHLGILSRAGLVRSRRDSRQVIYAVEPTNGKLPTIYVGQQMDVYLDRATEKATPDSSTSGQQEQKL